MSIKFLELLKSLFFCGIKDYDNMRIQKMLFKKGKSFFTARPSAYYKSTLKLIYPFVLAAPDLHYVSIKASYVSFDKDLFCLIWL